MTDLRHAAPAALVLATPARLVVLRLSSSTALRFRGRRLRLCRLRPGSRRRRWDREAGLLQGDRVLQSDCLLQSSLLQSSLLQDGLLHRGLLHDRLLQRSLLHGNGDARWHRLLQGRGSRQR